MHQKIERDLDESVGWLYPDRLLWDRRRSHLGCGVKKAFGI